MEDQISGSMRKLSNPYARYKEYNCFGCSPGNPIGLQMQFYEEEELIRCEWEPGTDYQGFHNVLHGGIQATLMDEIASWVVFMKLDTAGVTYRMNTLYRKPVLITLGRITLRARLTESNRRIATIQVELLDGEGKVCSESEVEYFVFPRERAEKDFHFPGREAFYEQT